MRRRGRREEKGGNPAKTSSRAGQVVHSCLPNSQACRAVLSSAIPEKAANRACVIASVRVTYHRCLTGGRRRHGWLCPNPSWSPYLHVTACPRVCWRQSSLSRDFIHSLSFYNSVFLRLSLSLSLCPRSLSQWRISSVQWECGVPRFNARFGYCSFFAGDLSWNSLPLLDRKLKKKKHQYTSPYPTFTHTTLSFISPSSSLPIPTRSNHFIFLSHLSS